VVITGHNNTLSLKSPLGIATATNSQEYYESKGAEGEATAQSIMSSKEECHYEGKMLDFKPNGLGRMVYISRGETYNGDWWKGMRHGKGEHDYSDGRYASGHFMFDRFRKGEMNYPEGDIYEGEFKDDKKHGKGTYTWNDGSKYTGDWKNGKRDGNGTFTSSNGRVYSGDWLEDKKHGKGIIKHTSGTTYEGEWSNDKMHGKGKKVCRDYTYDGSWKEGSKHGKGKKILANGDVFSGVWSGGKIGNGLLKESSGAVYKQVYNNGDLVSSKRCVSSQILDMIDGSPSKRPRTGGEAAIGVHVLSKRDVECPICFHRFSTEVDQHKPVLGLCNCANVCCHGCVLMRPVVGGWVKCMICEKDAFRPNEPKYDRRLMDMLSALVPVVSLTKK